LAAARSVRLDLLNGRRAMADALYVGIGLAFFGLAWLLVELFARLRGG
jgi:hypothetical protein